MTHPMLAQACNPLRHSEARRGAFIAYEIEMWIAGMHYRGLRWCDLDDKIRPYLGDTSMRALVLATIIDRSRFNRRLSP